MPTAKLTQTIKRPIGDVLATVTDVTTFPEWNPTTVTAERLTDGPIGEGTRYRMAIRGFGKQDLELQNFETNRRVRLVPFSKVVGGGHLFEFQSDDDHTRIDHVLAMEPKGVFKVLAPFMGTMARKNLKDTAEALQNYLESRGSEES